jgi:hypothetical protein
VVKLAEGVRTPSIVRIVWIVKFEPIEEGAAPALARFWAHGRQASRTAIVDVKRSSRFAP